MDLPVSKGLRNHARGISHSHIPAFMNFADRAHRAHPEPALKVRVPHTHHYNLYNPNLDLQNQYNDCGSRGSANGDVPHKGPKPATSSQLFRRPLFQQGPRVNDLPKPESLDAPAPAQVATGSKASGPGRFRRSAFQLGPSVEDLRVHASRGSPAQNLVKKKASFEASVRNIILSTSGTQPNACDVAPCQPTAQGNTRLGLSVGDPVAVQKMVSALLEIEALVKADATPEVDHERIAMQDYGDASPRLWLTDLLHQDMEHRNTSSGFASSPPRNSATVSYTDVAHRLLNEQYDHVQISDPFGHHIHTTLDAWPEFRALMTPYEFGSQLHKDQHILVLPRVGNQLAESSAPDNYLQPLSSYDRSTPSLSSGPTTANTSPQSADAPAVQPIFSARRQAKHMKLLNDVVVDCARYEAGRGV